MLRHIQTKRLTLMVCGKHTHETRNMHIGPFVVQVAVIVLYTNDTGTCLYHVVIVVQCQHSFGTIYVCFPCKAHLISHKEVIKIHVSHYTFVEN